jgi:hypothetical protein
VQELHLLNEPTAARSRRSDRDNQEGSRMGVRRAAQTVGEMLRTFGA